jgi:hypothetical protein
MWVAHRKTPDIKPARTAVRTIRRNMTRALLVAGEAEGVTSVVGGVVQSGRIGETGAE